MTLSRSAARTGGRHSAVHGSVRPARVEARAWGWRHAGRRAWAVREVDLVIEPGERVLLLGASGAGKSTLMHALAGVLGGDEEGEQSGSLTLDGTPVRHPRGRAGLVLQDPDSQVILARVGDDVAFGCENLAVPTAEIWPRVTGSLTAVGLKLPLDHPTEWLSGGQQQRLALAGVLAMRPGLLLLDEPTANLDPSGVVEVRDAVVAAVDQTGMTLVVVEHRVSTWLPVVDRVVVLAAGGGLLADGRPGDVLGSRRRELAELGIWVPDQPLAVPGRRRASSPEPLLSAYQLTIGRHPAHPALTDIDLTVGAGESVAVTGPNGVGKSTLALTLAGLLPPLRGQVVAHPLLAGSASSRPHSWRSRELVSRVGVVFQEPEHQFLASSVRAELAVGPRVTGRSGAEIDTRVGELLERLRLAHLAEANPFTLSGGEKRRLSVATVLATGPELLVLDEPTFGQDARTWVELVALLSELIDQGRTVVSVTHDLALVDALADRVIALTGPESGP